MTRRTPHDIVRYVATLYIAAVAAGDSRTVTAFAEAHGVGQASLYRALARLDAPRRNRRVEGAPPLDELEDACARWGFDGAAEEYDVSEETVREWLRAYGEMSEGRKP